MENDNGNEEMEEEEEDPEEDLNWVKGEVQRTPTPPVLIEENVNHVPNQTNWDIDRDLDIPDYGRVGPEIDPTVWRDIYEVNEYPQAANEVVPESMEIENENEAIMKEAREAIDRIWEEARREVGIEENNDSEQRARDDEEEEEQEQEISTRPSRRRRLTVRAYLRQFIRRDDDSSSSRRPPLSPTQEDSE